MARIGTFLFKAARIREIPLPRKDSVLLTSTELPLRVDRSFFRWGYIDKSAFNQFRKEMLDSIKLLKGAIRFILSLWRN